MPRKITFFAFHMHEEDDFSNKLLRILSGLVNEVKDIVKLSSREVWPAFAVTNVKILLPSALGGGEELECEIWETSKNYEELMKRKFELTSVPAVKIGDDIFVREHAVSIASELYTLLTTRRYISSDQILYHLVATARPPVTSVLRQTISEKISSLEKLYREKKIDEETYRKIKKTYEEILGRT
jgi:hypothetical protein